MQITQSQFVVSNSDVGKCPQDNLPEYAFIGRSNVGKSSLINMLCNKSALAKTSGTPGKTQLINHFIINNQWYIVDLPGYGYAKVSKSIRESISRIISSYLIKRKQLTTVFLLIDCRHKPQDIDLEFIEFLGVNGVPFAITFTKADKLKPNDLEQNIEAYKQRLLQDWEELPPIFVTSSSKQMGRDEILDYIEKINKSIGL